MTEEVRYGEPLLPRSTIEELSFEDVESHLVSFDTEREHLLSMRKSEYTSMAATYWLSSLVMGVLCGAVQIYRPVHWPVWVGVFAGHAVEVQEVAARSVICVDCWMAWHTSGHRYTALPPKPVRRT